MGIPLSYNLRNLVVRRTTSIFTVAGVALTVAVLLSVLGLVNGLRRSFTSTGHPDHLLVLRKGSTSELISTVSRNDFQVMKVMPGLARTPEGEPLASHEMITVINIDTPDAPGGMNINLRGLAPIGFGMRDRLKLTEGRMFTPGRREAVVGSAVARRCPAARLGGRLQFGKGVWDVVGIMDGGATAYSSEVFVDANLISTDYERTAVLSSALLRVEPGRAQSVKQMLIDDRRLNAEALPEREYYSRQTSSALPIQFMGTVVALIMAVGSVFSAMNTMFAAVARRSPEIGTLRTLGFSRVQILASFLVESLLLSAAGGIVGVVLVLPLRNWTSSIGSFVTFSETSFRFQFGPGAMAAGILCGLLIGAVGGLVPAASAARTEILNALRSRTA
jgi:putative ABC transport system permease protein